jgi:hypothetical protein
VPHRERLYVPRLGILFRARRLAPGSDLHPHAGVVPLLAIVTLLFVVWVGTLTVALLRSTGTGSRVASSVDGAGRAPDEPDET